MEQTLRDGIALNLWHILRCRPAVATALLCLLSVAALFALLRAPAVTALPLTLPGMPLGLAVDSATHDAILTTEADNGVLSIYETSAPKLGGVVFPDGYGTAVAVDPVAGYVYVASTLSQIVVFASPLSAPLATIDLDQQDQKPVGLAVNPATGRVFVTTQYLGRTVMPGDLVVIDGRRDTVVRALPFGPGPLRVAVDPTANRVYVTDDENNTLTVLDGATNAMLGTLPLAGGGHELAVNARTGRVYVSNSADHSVSVLDGPNLQLLTTVPIAGSAGAVGVNESLDRVYVVTDKGTVAVLDGETGRQLRSVKVGEQPTGLAVDAASDRIYVTDPIHGTVWLLLDRRFGHPSVRLVARVVPTADSLDADPSNCLCPGTSGR